MFVDEETKIFLRNSSDPDSSAKIGLWRIVEVHNLPYSDSRRNGKVIVFLRYIIFLAYFRVFTICRRTHKL